jgi:hypothetical protein
MAVFANFCLYQLGWLACVLGAGMDRAGLGMTGALVLVVVHRLDRVAAVGGRYCLPRGESRTLQTAADNTRRADGAD